MPRYHVTITVRILETWVIDAPDKEAAAEGWSNGQLDHIHDECLDTAVYSIEEV